jgi:hypothetical protein
MRLKLSDFYFSRAADLDAFDRALSADPVFGTPSGVFLAAARRTGKTAFLRRELVPHLRAQGKIPIYVDLRADSRSDPAETILAAVAEQVQMTRSFGRRAIERFAFTNISVGGLTVQLGSNGQKRGATLSEALASVAKAGDSHVVLIIDEAQHALNTKAGVDAMFALKSARDTMNTSSEPHRLFLLCTGSHRDKLAALVIDRSAPFYGGVVHDFPKLGREYTDALVARLNPRLAADNQLDPDDVARAFELLGHRPEKLTEVIREHALGEEGSAGLRRTVTDRADALRARVWQQHESDYGALSDLQRAVLGVLIEDGPAFAPFAERTLSRIGTRLPAPPTTSEVQKALDALRERSLVWRPTRGLYALEDQDMRDWLLGAV